jgi:hypothetical protein
VRRRLQRHADWVALLRSGWRPRFDQVPPEVASWAGRAWEAIRQYSDIPQRLAPWCHRPVPLQPCLCDSWHDHVLFESDAVTGLIDYGSAKIDHVAVDLARMLGSLMAARMKIRRG